MRKRTALAVLCFVVVCGMSPWFATAAVLSDMAQEGGFGPGRQALLTAGVQAGFVVGALISAGLGLSDRFDPRGVMACAALMNALVTAGLFAVPLGSDAAIALRVAAGAGFAGIYPPAMKIAVGWSVRDRGFLVGLLVGALTLGSAMPYLFAWMGGTAWRPVVAAASIASLLAAAGSFMLRLGPYHARASTFSARSIVLMWTDRRIRSATGGYLGHMWELYAMWGWIGAAAAVGFARRLPEDQAKSLAAMTAFLAIAIGAMLCAPAGRLADRIGKAPVSAGAMLGSGSMALATALSFGGPVWLSMLVILIWGAMVIPDSAQFSAMIADAAPPEVAGSLMTMQTALGFGLTIFTVQATPVLAGWLGWPVALALMAIGPALGIAALSPMLRRDSQSPDPESTP
ncbi:MFS transporter [Paracoccus sp. SCSIO 75233]|uniref:MFS transporter n=1 Tax=Paracoccus sp. SCSIO 75233 TaxID=3017782 RepID=UPI0022F00B3E|nr:MFS transporter [Paracoccus sp. SCSIO 75233]WBU53026.1 MFS transporter [Paracoccus sp. SCSIO 75233]